MADVAEETTIPDPVTNTDTPTAATTLTPTVDDTEAVAVAEVGEEEKEEEEEEAGHKVFVGNLNFKTSEENIAQFFSEVGKVLKVNIITRGSRSLGYGFVAFETAEEAQQATEKLNKKMLDGRDINVEIAKPKDTSREGPSRRRTRGFGRGTGRGYFRGGFRSYRGGFRRGYHARGSFRDRDGRGQEGPVGNWEDQGEEDVNENEENVTQDQSGGPNRRFRRRQGEDSAEDKVDNEVPNGEATDEAPRGGRRGRGGRGRGRGRRGRGRGGRFRSMSRRHSSKTEGQESEPSKTTVFVANLPFATNDEGLRELFNGFKVKSAHVVKRRSGRSKGFGFVDLEDEGEQQKVLEGMQNVETEGRQLVIKVAHSEPHTTADENPAEVPAGEDTTRTADADFDNTA